MTGGPLKRRYLAKLGGNAFGTAVAFGAQAIVLRRLGPAAYGSFSFLTTFFAQIADLLDAGTSTAFFTALSRRPKDGGLIRFYAGYLGCCLLALAVGVGAAWAAGLQELLWRGQALSHVWLALGWVALSKAAQVLGAMVDAYGLTVQGEWRRGLHRVLSLAALAGWALGGGGLTAFFFCQYLIFVALLFFWGGLLGRGGAAEALASPPSKPVGEYKREFRDYAAPLMVVAATGAAVGLLDRWILQRWGGEVEQGYFALGSQLGGFCLLFSGAMTSLITREFAVRHAAGDLAGMRRLFLEGIPPLYFVTAYFSLFLFARAEAVAVWMGGEAFRGASSAVRVLALYPLCQVYGQLSGALLYATGQTVRCRNLGLWSALADVALTVALVAPPEWNGLGWGAMGLGIKTVLVSWGAVNVQLWWNARFLGEPFVPWLLSQCGVAAWGLACAAAAGLASGRTAAPSLLGWGVEAAVYTGLFFGGAALFPSLLLTDRARLGRLLKDLIQGRAVAP